MHYENRNEAMCRSLRHPGHDRFGVGSAAAGAEATRAGRKLPAWIHVERIVLRAFGRRPGCNPEAVERHLPVGLDVVGVLLFAKWIVEVMR